MPGVRGFDDPKKRFAQKDPSSPQGYLLPFHADTTKTNAEQIPSTSHSWGPLHDSWNGGKMDGFVTAHLASDGSARHYTMSYVPPTGFSWETYPEMLTKAGVSWKVYQENDNYGTNVLEYFDQYQNAMRFYQAGQFELITGVKNKNITDWRRKTVVDFTTALGHKPGRFPRLPDTVKQLELAEKRAIEFALPKIPTKQTFPVQPPGRKRPASGRAAERAGA